MKHSTVQFALIGCGNIGARHAACIQHFGKLVAVCDVDIEKANSFAKKFSSLPFYTFESLLKNAEAFVDVCVICTPNGFHAQQSILALQHGMHIICEKPMALAYSDCIRMMEAATQHKKLLFIVKQNRFNPPVVALKQIIEAGHLGALYSLHLSCFWSRGKAYYEQSSWRGRKDLDGGILFTQFSHFIDILYWIAGNIHILYAKGSNFAHQHQIEFEDTGLFCFQTASGALGSMHYSINSYEKNSEGSLSILAEKGTVKIGGSYLNKMEYAHIQNFTLPVLPEGNMANEYKGYTGSMSNHEKVYEWLMPALLQNNLELSNAYESAQTVKIIEQIYKAMSLK